MVSMAPGSVTSVSCSGFEPLARSTAASLLSDQRALLAAGPDGPKPQLTPGTAQLAARPVVVRVLVHALLGDSEPAELLVKAVGISDASFELSFDHWSPGRRRARCQASSNCRMNPPCSTPFSAAVNLYIPDLCPSDQLPNADRYTVSSNRIIRHVGSSEYTANSRSI